MSIEWLLHKFIFWGIWLVIPFLWEILAGMASAAFIIFKKGKEIDGDLEFFPKVTIIVPVYHSRATLEKCLLSIINQSYPKASMEVYLIDNGTSDGSYNIFTKYQEMYPDIAAWWFSSEQGKSKALNMGVFSSTGKYIINIDSDGYLDNDAVLNVVRKFESDENITGMTGVVLIGPQYIEMEKRKLIKCFNLCEFFEYTESFLVGRNIQSVFNSLHTMAGAFSCFRREALFKTQMYNSDTVGEDAHMTFQIRDFAGGRIILCEDAFLFVDPVESLDHLYIQRQRWQRAGLEVANLFTRVHLGGIISFLSKPSMRKLISDHTLAFPKLIWLFAMIYLYFINYPPWLLIGANMLLYSAYVLNSFIYMNVSLKYLKSRKAERDILIKNWYICFIMPLYRFGVYWIRFAGIINSITTQSRWSARTFSEEIDIAKTQIKKVRSKFSFMDSLKKIINSR